MICPMISCKRLEPYQCEGSECAWWIGDKKQGKCSVKGIGMDAGEFGDIIEAINNLGKTINSICDKI